MSHVDMALSSKVLSCCGRFENALNAELHQHLRAFGVNLLSLVTMFVRVLAKSTSKH